MAERKKSRNGRDDGEPADLAAERAKRAKVEAEQTAEEKSIEERAAEGEAEEKVEPGEPPLPMLPSDRQLSLNVGGSKRAKVESEISIMSAAREISALLDPDTEQQLIISVVPQEFKYVPVRENGQTVRFKLRQSVRVTRVARVGTEYAEQIATGQA